MVIVQKLIDVLPRLVSPFQACIWGRSTRLISALSSYARGGSE